MTMTGPYEDAVINTASLYQYKKWYRQKPPFPNDRRPFCPYKRVRVVRVRTIGSPVVGVNSSNLLSSLNGLLDTGRARTKAYQKFISQVSKQAMLAVNYAERRQAFSSMTKRLNQIAGAALALRRGKALVAAKALGIRYRGKPFVAAKDAADTWLEWHFGWEPLLGDIHAACEILQSEWRPAVVTASSGCVRTVKTNPALYRWSQDQRIQWRVRLQADVRCTNPMLWQANQLGLINPASIAWELVPFSFLVDWFIPIGAFLESYTDFAGLQIENAFTTYYGVGQDTLGYTQPSGNSLTQLVGYICDRRAGISLPIPRWTPPVHLSPARAYTALSLAIQQLAKLDRKIGLADFSLT